MPKTAVGLFESPSVADQVVRALTATGFPRNEIRTFQEASSLDDAGLRRELLAMGATESEASSYIEGVRTGGAMVFAAGSGDMADQAATLMARHGGMQIEELAAGKPASRTASPHLELNPPHYVATPPVESSSSQTGRVRQGGEGVRVFVW